SGYRVTLTFNLMLTEPATPNQPRGPADEVSRYLIEHFTSPVTSTYVGEDPREPIRLAFLLDHEYTQAGLSSGRFKGADVNRVALLRDAAERADCETVFALAEVQESCSAIPKGATWHYDCYGGGYYGGGQPDPAGDSTEVNVDDYDLGSPNHRAMTLGWWVGAEGSGAEPINLDLLRDEICTVTNSNSLKPYASAYHGYMGNDGNTLDRWYRGAAVVVWPKAKSFAARAEATPTLALSGLLSRIVAGDLEGARADAASLEPVWRRVDPAILPLAVDVAVALRDPQAARVVMEPFALEVLTTEHAAGLAALAREYGAPWMNEVVERWGTVRRHVGAGRFDWVADTLPALCQALRECDASALADSIGDRVWRSLSTHVNVGVRETRGDQRNVDLFALGLPLARLLEAVSDPVGVRIIAELRTLDDNVMELLVAILRAHRPPARAAIRAIADDCCERVTRLVEAPVHTPDDSTSWTGCGCELCLRLASFLAAPSERTLTWQLATPGREHEQRQLDAAALPVRHTTRRQGRPFTLVVEKTA
ncbi:MAG: hypothetical protein QG597_1191, partial [Actinomycetota bacterium]|nr:hypothetical protein [Actinomycetota bacterium]